MQNSCGCGGSKPSTSTVDQILEVPTVPALCSDVVHETVCVQADITIMPVVTVGEIESFCVGGPVIGPCPGTPVMECNFKVSQSICVQIPLTFSAEAVAIPSGIVCGTPDIGKCSQ